MREEETNPMAKFLANVLYDISVLATLLMMPEEALPLTKMAKCDKIGISSFLLTGCQVHTQKSSHPELVENQGYKS